MNQTALRSRCAAALLLVLSQTAYAEGLEAVQQILGDSDSSPVPLGWTVGGAAYAGSSPYSVGSASRLAMTSI